MHSDGEPTLPEPLLLMFCSLAGIVGLVVGYLRGGIEFAGLIFSAVILLFAGCFFAFCVAAIGGVG